MRPQAEIRPRFGVMRGREFLKDYGVEIASGPLTGLAARAVGPPPPAEVGKIVSARLGETREYWVSLPDAYRDGTTRYPVVYMMDGELNFSSATIGGLRLAAQLGDVPDFIVVGIPNTDRGRDVFPEVVTYGDGSRDGGRAE